MNVERTYKFNVFEKINVDDEKINVDDVLCRKRSKKLVNRELMLSACITFCGKRSV